MSKSEQRRQTDRLTRLRNRFDFVAERARINPKSYYSGELSALEWAIPILEDHIIQKFGSILPERSIYGNLRKKTVTALIKRDGTVCYLCDEHILRKHMTIDHVIPLCKGGTNEMDNFRLTHSSCNSEKGNMMLDEWCKSTGKDYELYKKYLTVSVTV